MSNLSYFRAILNKSKLLRSMTNAPWYVSNHTLHFDLRIPYVYMVFRERSATHRTTLDSQPQLPSWNHECTRRTTGV